MKKILLGLVVGVLIAIPATALAGYATNSDAKLISGAQCTYVVGNDGKSYPSRCNIEVYKMTSGPDTCYLTNKSSISCVRGN